MNTNAARERISPMKLIFGCGYLGRRVAQRWLAAGEPVAAVTRSADRADEFRRQGIRPLLADVTRPETLVDLPTADTLLFAVGYDRRAGLSRWQVYVDGLRNVLDAAPGEIGRIVMVSSTGVYGDHQGAWVDEQTPCRPAREAGEAFLAAEQLLRESRFGEKSVILRMAGLYGPGRLMRRPELLAGDALVVVPGYLNLIHVDDAAEAVLAAATRASPPRTYLVSDGRPVERRDYLRHLAALLGAPEPRFEVVSAREAVGRRGTDSKRVCHARLVDELDFRPKYPSYREGLAAALAFR